MLAALITNIQVKQAMGESNNSAPQKPLAYLHIRSGNSPDYTLEKRSHSNTGKIAGLDHKQDFSSTPTPLCLQSGKHSGRRKASHRNLHR